MYFSIKKLLPLQVVAFFSLPTVGSHTVIYYPHLFKVKKGLVTQ